jgi:hypothetical protein
MQALTEHMKIKNSSKLTSHTGVFSVGCLPSIDVFDSHHLQIRLITHGPVPSVNNKKEVQYWLHINGNMYGTYRYFV